MKGDQNLPRSILMMQRLFWQEFIFIFMILLYLDHIFIFNLILLISCNSHQEFIECHKSKVKRCRGYGLFILSVSNRPVIYMFVMQITGENSKLHTRLEMPYILIQRHNYKACCPLQFIKNLQNASNDHKYDALPRPQFAVLNHAQRT